MGLLLGDIAEWMSTSQINNNFYLIRTPLFKQFLDICVWNYPDPLDLHAWSYEIVPMYLIAGAIDYGIMVFFTSLYSQFMFIVTARGTPTTDQSLLAELQDPRSKAFQALFLLSFALRAWNLGIGNIKRTSNFHSLQWHEMRTLTILVLLLCPALFWNWFLETAFTILRLDRERPWLAQLFWLMLSRDWDIAQLYSGFFVSKGTEVLQQESEARLNESWGGFVKRCIRITLIATPLEIFVKNLPYIVIALVFAVGRNGPAIGALIGELVRKLRKFSFTERILAIDKVVSAKRDHLILLLIRYFNASRWNQDSEGLPNHRFRLLQLEPSAYPDGPIICALSWHNLDSKPSYTAISYFWGSDEQISTIILNGKRCKTTASAFTALKGLRSRWRKQNFWIDAICIDQTSDADKAEQICIMADIYRNAKQVTVWLGPDEEGTLALSLVRRLLIRSSLGNAMGSLRYSLDAPRSAWKALQRLLQNPWFQRSWVVQEVMSSNVIIQYGDAQLDWMILSQFAMAIESEIHTLAKLHSSAERNNQSTLKDNTLKIRYIRIMEEFRSMHSGNNRHLSLLFYLIRMFRSSSRFKASNTQDRIYALLNLSGLATDVDFNALLSESDLLGNKTPKNTPDYHVRLSKFFTTVTQHFLSSGPENRRLDFLVHAGTCHTHGKTRLPNLPSWVPDWAVDDPSSIPFIGHDGTLELLQHPRLNGILEGVANLQSYDEISFTGRPKQEAARKKLNAIVTEMLDKTIYRAAKDTLPSFDLINHSSLGNNLLEVRGISIDRIHKISSVNFPASRLGPTLFYDPVITDHLKDLNSTLNSWLELAATTFYLSNSVDNPATRLSHYAAFERTLLADVSHPTFDFTLPNAPIRPTPLEKLGFAARQISLSRGLVKLDDLPEGRENSWKLLGEWIVHLGITYGGRVFRVTETGRMGLFPMGCGVGDEVVVIRGVGVPFVLSGVSKPELQGGEERESSEVSVDDQETDEEREIGQRLYELVGPAYVHGVMDGEGTKGMPKRSSFILK